MPGVRSWFRLVWVFERAASCRVCPPRSQIACSGKRCVARAATGWAPCQWLLISATRVSATLTSCPRRAWQTQKVSLSKTVHGYRFRFSCAPGFSYLVTYSSECRLKVRLTFVINDHWPRKSNYFMSCNVFTETAMVLNILVQRSCCVQICHNILERPNF